MYCYSQKKKKIWMQFLITILKRSIKIVWLSANTQGKFFPNLPLKWYQDKKSVLSSANRNCFQRMWRQFHLKPNFENNFLEYFKLEIWMARSHLGQDWGQLSYHTIGYNDPLKSPIGNQPESMINFCYYSNPYVEELFLEFKKVVVRKEGHLK